MKFGLIVLSVFICNWAGAGVKVTCSSDELEGTGLEIEYVGQLALGKMTKIQRLPYVDVFAGKWDYLEGHIVFSFFNKNGEKHTFLLEKDLFYCPRCPNVGAAVLTSETGLKKTFECH